MVGATSRRRVELHNSRLRSSELYLSIPRYKREAISEPAFSTSTPARSRSPRPPLSFAAASPVVSIGPPVQGDTARCVLDVAEITTNQLPAVDLEQSEEASILAAQSFFVSKEFRRAVHALRECKSFKAQFLSVYCQFLVRNHTSAVENTRSNIMRRSVRGTPRESGIVISVSERTDVNARQRLTLDSAVRRQPPIPFNRSLLDLLELVKNTTDPWVTFL